jgi:hypothetical protein
MHTLVPPYRSRPATRGFVLITTVLTLVVLMAFLGLAIDVGYVQFVKTRMQTAADAAALGGVQEIKANGTAGAVAAARADAALNGFTNGRGGVTVAVNNPPATGYYQTDATAVEVVISQTVPAFFLQLAGTTSTTVRARAVAREGSGTSCLYTLDPTGSNSFSASGGATVQVSCGVLVNSSSSQAMNVSGGAHVTGAYVSVVGGYSSSGGGVISPAPTTGAMAEFDPLSYLPAPSVGSCTQTNLSVSGVARTLDPGVYCNGIRISGGANVTLNSGTYILEGGGLNVSGGATLSGPGGVTFYNTAGGGYGYGAINISGGTNINLVAPTTGSLAGILFYQDRSISSGAGSSLSGGSSAVFQGTLYFPTTTLNYSGGSSSSAAYTVMVAKSVNFSGGTILNNDYSSLPGGSPVKGSAALSE